MRSVEVHASDDGWAGTVAFAGGPEPFAYVPDEIVIAGRRGRDVASELYGGQLAEPEAVFASRDDGPGQFFTLRLRGDLDVVSAVHELRAEGVTAQPNHMLFAHGACSCCGPHPAERWQSCVSAAPVYATPVYATPVYATPVYATPVYATPVYATPVYATPVYATELQATGHRRSSAAPATAPTNRRRAPAGASTPRVTILDTGLARDGLRPHDLDGVHHPANGWTDVPDDDGDDYLDPAAGHGTFIAGLIELLAPGCEITVDRVLSNYGAGDEVAIAQHIDAADTDILNLSFGGYALQHMDVLASAIRAAQQRGTVVVASAGNDGICRPSLPAALPDVISVAALGPNGPARFSNYGPWVRACAPGVDLVSYFFTQFDGAETAPPGGVDPDKFASWARWSGSSFAAPVVAAALAREMQCYGSTALQAVPKVVDAPGLLRIPDFGTVVNVQ